MGAVKVDPTTQLSLPPGFRFYPTDEELLVHYLCRKVAGNHFALQIIGEVDLYKYDPWVLPGKALFGEKEWYFFSPRDRKYPNGSRPNRVAASGYWKATGTDKIITSEGKKVGIKKALVFYVGKAPKGTKTNWIMHEYRLAEPTRKKGSIRLDDWVLCRLYKKNSGTQKPVTVKEQSNDTSYTTATTTSCSSQLDDVMDYLPEINDSFFDLPRMNSLKSLQDPKLFQNIGGRKISQTDMTETESNCQKLKPVKDFYFPSIPALCHVDSPSDKIESTVEDEVESDLRSQQLESTSLFQSFSHMLDPFEFAYPTHPEYRSLAGVGNF